MKPRLAVIAGRPVTLDADADWDLPLRAQMAYPGSHALQTKWIEARRYLGARHPSVKIGAQRCDTSRAFRSLREAGINGYAEVIELPWFLSRFFRACGPTGKLFKSRR